MKAEDVNSKFNERDKRTKKGKINEFQIAKK